MAELLDHVTGSVVRQLGLQGRVLLLFVSNLLERQRAFLRKIFVSWSKWKGVDSESVKGEFFFPESESTESISDDVVLSFDVM